VQLTRCYPLFHESKPTDKTHGILLAAALSASGSATSNYFGSPSNIGSPNALLPRNSRLSSVSNGWYNPARTSLYNRSSGSRLKYDAPPTARSARSTAL